MLALSCVVFSQVFLVSSEQNKNRVNKGNSENATMCHRNLFKM
jgi:hypothetical protein